MKIHHHLLLVLAVLLLFDINICLFFTVSSIFALVTIVNTSHIENHSGTNTISTYRCTCCRLILEKTTHFRSTTEKKRRRKKEKKRRKTEDRRQQEEYTEKLITMK